MREGRKSWDCASLVPGYSPWRLQRHEHSRLSRGPYAWVDVYNDPSGVTELSCTQLLRPLKGSAGGALFPGVSPACYRTRPQPPAISYHPYGMDLICYSMASHASGATAQPRACKALKAP